jgi:hypothetical protein
MTIRRMRLTAQYVSSSPSPPVHLDESGMGADQSAHHSTTGSRVGREVAGKPGNPVFSALGSE